MEYVTQMMWKWNGKSESEWYVWCLTVKDVVSDFDPISLWDPGDPGQIMQWWLDLDTSYWMRSSRIGPF